MRALVTGGGGFLGRYIVEQLLERGDDVRVFTRGAYPELEPAGVDIQRGDLRDPAAVERACRECEAVFHVAAVPGIWGPWEQYHSINTLGTQNVIAACRSAGVARLVYTSSPSVVYDGRPHENADESLPYPESYLCHYPHSKGLAERDVLAANESGRLLTVALRPHLIWGPRDNHLIPRLIQRARSGRLRRVGTGENLISMSYVENSAAAHLQAHDALAETGKPAGKAYFINEKEPVTLWRWIDEILALAEVPPVRKSLSAASARRIGAVCELVYRVLRLPGEPPMTRFLASQLAQSHYYDTTAARRDFGYSEIVSVDEGMRRLGEDVRKRGL